MTKDKNPGDYEVGYGKPPKHTRFPPGQSGNPKGREKGKKGLKTDLAAELDARQTIQINGEKISGRRQRLAVRTLAMRAAAGDQKAQSIFFPLILQVLGVEDRGTGGQKLSPQDQAILDAMLDEAGDALDADETGSSNHDGEQGNEAGR
ncbi:MAG: hypothetical protein JNL35_00905 [Sphingopyxis sp.]|nr:hypothetical protein [Sphingopyxis sp.]